MLCDVSGCNNDPLTNKINFGVKIANSLDLCTGIEQAPKRRSIADTCSETVKIKTRDDLNVLVRATEKALRGDFL